MEIQISNNIQEMKLNNQKYPVSETSCVRLERCDLTHKHGQPQEHIVTMNNATHKICLQWSQNPGKLEIAVGGGIFKFDEQSDALCIQFNHLSAFNHNIGKSSKKMFMNEKDELLKHKNGKYLTDICTLPELSISTEHPVEIIGGYTYSWVIHPTN